MNELIKITEKDGQQLVSARELYVGLKYDTTQGNFSHWIEKQLENVDAIKNVDYTCLVFKNETNNGDATDYILTTKIAKEICMVVGAMPRTNKETKALSKKYREYFIKCEEKLKTIVQPTPSYMIDDPIERAKAWIKEQEKVKVLETQSEYLKKILESTTTVTMTQIAKDYGMTAQEMNSLLHRLKVQYKQNNQWLLYSKYHKEGYVDSETIPIKHKSGIIEPKMYTKWTQKGRKFLYELLKENEILPVIERGEQ